MGKPRHWGGKGGSAPSSSNQGWQQYESTWGNRGYAEHGREIVVRVEPGEGGKCSRKIVKKEKKKHRSSYSSDFHSSSSPSTMHENHEKKRRNEPKKNKKEPKPSAEQTLCSADLGSSNQVSPNIVQRRVRSDDLNCHATRIEMN